MPNRRLLRQLQPGGALFSNDLDSAGRITRTIDALDQATTITRDSLGYVTLEELPGGVSRSYAYQTAFHALTTFTDERSNTYLYGYDSLGHRTTETNPLSETTTSTFDGTTGLLTNIEDAENNLITYTHDGYRRPSTVTDVFGTTTSTYDSHGHLATVTDAKSRDWGYNYDAMEHLTRTIDPASQNWSSEYGQ